LVALPTHQKQITRFALAAGLRQANVLGVKWPDVDMKRRKSSSRSGFFSIALRAAEFGT